MSGSLSIRSSAAVAATGLDHARLAYHYLDTGDMDGFASLFAEEVELLCPGAAPIRSRAAIEASTLPTGRHLVRGMFGAGGRIAATGVFHGEVTVEFADIFAISPDGLLKSQARYFFTPPR